MKPFLSYLFDNAGQIGGFIAMITVLIKWNRLNQVETWIGLLVMGSFGFDVLAVSFGYSGINNSWVYNIASFVEISLLFYIFFRSMENGLVKNIIKYGYPVFVMIYLSNFFFIQKPEVVNTFTIIPSQACVALLSFLYLRDCFNRLDDKPFRNFTFWFALACLIDYTVSTPLTGFLSWLPFEDYDLADRLYTLNYYIYGAWFAIITIGLLWTKRQAISHSL